jgi:hypothetical protein
VANWDDVRRVALGLPEADERVSRGLLQWRVTEKLFAWERPLRKGDLVALGEDAPTGAILGVRVADGSDKAAWIAEPSGHFFTTPHFGGYLAVLVKLDEVSAANLEQAMTEAWLARAPRRLADRFVRDARS